jgi:hypothetical protein
LELVLKLFKDSPHHAAELVGRGAAYEAQLRGLVAEVLDGSAERAELLLAFMRGLERDLSDPDTARARLREGIRIFTAGVEGAR